MIEASNSQQNQRFEYDEKRQQVGDLEMMIDDFRRMASDLDQQIKIEQQAAGVSDVNHFAYPTFARAALIRRDNLRSSIAELEKRLDRAREEALEAFEQLPKHARRCVFWEVDPATLGNQDHLADPEFEKEAWLSMVMLEWGSCGQVATAVPDERSHAEPPCRHQRIPAGRGEFIFRACFPPCDEPAADRKSVV